MTMSEYEDAIKRFLRKISPDREWQYIGEVEHAWMGELYDELVAEFKDENDELRELVRKAHACKTDDGCCEDCYQDEGCCPIERDMQELGIEVDK